MSRPLPSRSISLPPDPSPSRRPTGRLRSFTLAGAVLALAAVTLPVVAQSSQYTAPGGGVTGEPATREQIESQMEAARWRLGPVRVAPWLGLRGLTWDQNVFVDETEETSDVTGSAGAGLSAYLPTGPDVFWIAQVMPEYLFWLDLDDRSRWIGRYGFGVLADLNRLRLEADVRRTEQQQVVTVERPEQVVSDTRRGGIAATLELGAAFSLAAGWETLELRQERPGDEGRAVDPDADFRRLDRDETVVRGELRWEPTDALRLVAGAEVTETDFAPGARNLSSTGTSPFARLHLDGNRVQLDARVVRRELEPEPGSELQPTEQTEGRAQLTLTPGWRFTFGLYGSRGITYALDRDYTYLVDERLGVETRAPFGERLSLRAFLETGTADFEPRLAATARRSDDLTAYGADATYRLGEWVFYRAGLHQVTIDSNLPGFDRDYLRVTSSLVLSTGDWVWQ